MNRNSIIIFFLLFFMYSCKNNEKQYFIEIEMNNDWELTSGDSVHIPASVPGLVISDLYKNNLIENPYLADNINTLQWIGKTKWVYSTTFDAPTEITQMDSVYLAFEGLIGSAEIVLNDSVLGSVNDCYTVSSYYCKNKIRYRGNILRIIFSEFENDSLYEYSGNCKKIKADKRYPLIFNGTSVSPPVHSNGFLSSVKLIAWSGVKINDISVTTENISDDQASLSVNTEFLSTNIGKYDVEFYLNNRYILGKQKLNFEKGTNKDISRLVIKNPQLWWCNGLGNPYRYELTVVLKHKQRILSKRKQFFGIRTMHVGSQIDSLTFSDFIQLNGVPVFIKGANYLPVNLFQLESNENTYEQLILKAKSCNFNTLRVWGGGIYENEVFYDLCDTYGIMVWQDIMETTGNSSKITSAERLSQSVIKRLRKHPSVILWYNNREQYNTNPPVLNSSDNKNQLKQDSILDLQLFKKTPGIPYYSNEKKPIRKSKSREYKFSPSWSVWYNSSPFSAYKSKNIGLITEFGVQSVPDIKTLLTFDNESSPDMRSPLVNTHQFNKISWLGSDINGTQMIGAYLQMYYNEPRNNEAFWYLSQVFQSDALKYAIEYFRIRRPLCMGSIFWHFNDSWPSISFSVVDFYNRNKPAFYTVKKCYENIAVIPQLENNTITVWVANDSLNKLSGSFSLTIMDFSGNQLYNYNDSIYMDGNSVKSVFKMNYRQVFSISQSNKILCYTWLSKNGKKIADNIQFFTEPMYLDLPDPDINMQILNNGNRFQILFRSNTLAKNLILYTFNKDCVFSDNNFDLLPGLPYSVNAEYEGTETELQNDLQIMTLVDSY